MWENLKDFSIEDTADWDEVKRTYVEQLKIWHPDRFGQDESLRKKGEEKTKEITQIFTKLKQQLAEIQSDGIEIKWDMPILPQLIKAGVISYTKEPEFRPVKAFEQEPLVGKRVREARSENITSDYEGSLWHPQIIIAGMLSCIMLILGGIFIYKAYLAPRPAVVVYGPPADLSKFAKQKAVQQEDTFSKELEASVGVEQLRSSDGLIEGQLGGVRIISGVSSKNNEEIPAIVRAASRCDLVGVQKLIEKGAPVDSEDPDGMSSLSWAAKTNCGNLARYLLSKGANTKHISVNGFTPLAWARWYKNIDVIKVLELDSRNIVRR